MEEKYKEALRHIKVGKESPHQIFSTPWLYRSFDKAQALDVLSENSSKQKVDMKVNTATSDVVNSSDQSTSIPELNLSDSSEKAELLKGLKEFGENLVDSADSGEYSFEGGKISAKSNDDAELIVKSYDDCEGLNRTIKAHLGDNIYNLRFSDKQINSKASTKVLFVTDAYINESAIEDSPGISELCCFFHKEVAELFSRMISAMGLTGDEFFVSSISSPSLDEEQSLEALGSEIFHLNPKFIVSLGASATGKLLANNQRLKNIHGQLFDYKVSDQNDRSLESKLMPLFSPKLLHTAPNMKKTAWRDMQKLIELL